MEIDDLLSLGSPHKGGKSPLERKQERKSQREPKKQAIITSVKALGFKRTVDQMGVSDTSVAKVCAPLVRKGELNLFEISPDIPIAAVEEYIYAMNTSSIKRLVAGNRYSEAVLRLVKAHIEGNMREDYDTE